MSNWLAERQQEAFALYRSYLAMQLHLKPGLAFDYSLYGGNVRLGLDTFRKKTETVKRFMQFAATLKGEPNKELFVFANARRGHDIGFGDIRPCIKVFEEWKKQFGDKASFVKATALIIKSHYLDQKNNTPTDIIVSLLESGNGDTIEAVISYLHFYVSILPEVQEKIKDNAVWMMRWEHMLKIRSLYYHFGIL